MARVIGSLNMGLCRVLLVPWMISRRCALETVAADDCVWVISIFDQGSE